MPKDALREIVIVNPLVELRIGLRKFLYDEFRKAKPNFSWHIVIVACKEAWTGARLVENDLYLPKNMRHSRVHTAVSELYAAHARECERAHDVLTITDELTKEQISEPLDTANEYYDRVNRLTQFNRFYVV